MADINEIIGGAEDATTSAYRRAVPRILPLVYDDSLSYYELLCKVVNYINSLIDNNKEIISELDELKQEISTIEKWIADFNTSYAEDIIKNSIATMIFVEITNEGYIVYHIPSNWSNIQFSTTGLDTITSIQPEYGHLVLSY